MNIICFKEPYGESVTIRENGLRDGEEFFTDAFDSKTFNHIVFAYRTERMDGLQIQQQASFDGGKNWFDSEKSIVIGSMTPEVFGSQVFGNTVNAFDYPLSDLIRFKITNKIGEQKIFLAMRGCR